METKQNDELRKEAIRKICEERNITELVHFTHVKNLASILQEGLLSRKELEKHPNCNNFKFNDSQRLDRHPEAVCLSISFPNYQMFLTYHNNYNKSKWVVLSLAPDILWELDCAFYKCNAASKYVNWKSPEELKEVYCLKELFYDYNYDPVVERDYRVPKNFPTHPQAEVLVFEKIPPTKIMKVYFENKPALEDWFNQNPVFDRDLFTVNENFFSIRGYYDKPFWKGNS